MPNSETIERVEHDFWQALVEKDTETAAGMIAEDCLITAPSGAMRIDPHKYRAMMRDGNWSLDRFDFSDVEVIFPAEDTAVIAYKVRQQGTFKDEPMDTHCADSSTWVNDGGAWKCALHTETILEKA